MPLLKDMASDFFIRHGANYDVDGGTVPEDIWNYGGVYTFPSSAALVSIVSDSASDTLLGVGARTVLIYGLDANWNEQSETVSLSGLTPVSTVNTYIRVNCFKAESVGTSGVNVGNITCTHQGAGTPVVAYMTVGNGRCEQCVYTMPANYNSAAIWKYTVSVGKQAASDVECILQFREYGKSWQIIDRINSNSQGSSESHQELIYPRLLSKKSDIRLRCVYSSVDSVGINGLIEIGLY